MTKPSENGFETMADYLSALEKWFRDEKAAARAEAFAEIRRGVEAAPVLMREMFGSGDDRTVTDLIDRAAVLALLPAVPPEKK